jgi:hypothetical protein
MGEGYLTAESGPPRGGGGELAQALESESLKLSRIFKLAKAFLKCFMGPPGKICPGPREFSRRPCAELVIAFGDDFKEVCTYKVTNFTYAYQIYRPRFLVTK